MSDPNVKSVKVVETTPSKSNRQRRNSAPQAVLKNNKSPPKPSINTRTRRMSEPLTSQEKVYAKNDHQMKPK